MPLLGGAADKYGGRYEGLWAIKCIAEVMAERADAIRLEPPGAEGEGVEFRINKGDIREYHQVKRQRGRGERWTLAALGNEGILTHFKAKLNHPNAHCAFVSTDGASELAELADKARKAVSYAEFGKEFLAAEDWQNRFSTLCTRWDNCRGEEAFGWLQRIHVYTIDETILRSHAEALLEPLVEGDLSEVVDTLAQFALDSVHDQLRAYDVWAHLEDRGYRRRDWASDARVLGCVEAQNDRYLGALRQEAIGGRSVTREEARQATEILYSGDGRGVLLAGEAGVGKSGVILQVLENYRELRMPTLAVRVDRLDPTQLPEDVGRQMGLPGSPAAVLGTVAQGQSSILAIDQLDAVSLASGRRPELFDVVREIIRQAEAYPEMKVLLACRRFDLDNDHRLRSFARGEGTITSLDVRRLPEETVEEIVSSMGLDPARLRPKQVELLSVPLHLRLLEEISSTSTGQNLEFGSAEDLYDEFWRRKLQLVRDRANRMVAWTEVVDRLCDHMSERQTLSAPVETLDEHEEDASVMASEHVIVQDGNRYAFFHEGFFDYAFARRFSERGLELLPLLRGTEQHLFRRAQVRQILKRERDRDWERYLDDLSALLNGAVVRFHVKQVVFALLATLDDPTEEEWRILEPLFDGGEDAYQREVWNMLRTAPWFRLTNSLGLWQRWLDDAGDEQVNRLVNALWVVQKDEPDLVAELVEPYIREPGWRPRLAYLMRGANLHTGRRFFDLFLWSIEEGILDDIDLQTFLHDLPEKDAERCCEGLARYLKRRLHLSHAAGQPNPFDPFSGTIPGDHLYNSVVLESARQAPRTFVTELLPFILTVAQGLMEDDEPLRKDPVWGFRTHDRVDSLDEVLLAGMSVALGALAQNEPEVFEFFVEKLRNSEVETAQYLLVRAYAAHGARYADEAAEYLLDNPLRLETGFTANRHWATRQLLEAVTPHCSDENLATLEELVLGYYSEREQTEQGKRWRGSAQQTLLEGMTPARRSSAIEERLQELREKFGRNAVEFSPTIVGGTVTSPIPEAEAADMSDQEWFEAIASYCKDRHG